MSDIQNLRSMDVLVNPDGTPTTFFLRFLFDRGISQQEVINDIVQIIIDVDNLDNTKADKIRQIIAGAGLVGGGDLSSDRTLDVGGSSGRIVVNADNIDLATTSVTPGDYTSADISVDAYGRITAASNGSGGVASAYRPMVDGSLPPNLLYESDGSLIMEPFTP